MIKTGKTLTKIVQMEVYASWHRTSVQLIPEVFWYQYLYESQYDGYWYRYDSISRYRYQNHSNIRY